MNISAQPPTIQLGLAIVHELARVNGWQVRLENRATGGLAAWIELPAMPS